ncbi:phage tail fiber protein [Klebsiella quasipneumoniae]|uniref:phage tail fiber domain-containing protein n=1 Tax=Klebsiella quasipneumoniae TaxID=1463165 RepID=UPI00248041D1|nr:phage tail fiber protein [Klebsiella quasipneumoniae]HBQ9084890.1 endo-N-neuraminidase [Klebsiella quasipneumoniae]HBQ9091106.1 endo-N-neuraminidase [Klebsiella quasipneumoniae]HBQ9096397.1 endo-N-neuraminidase [Klebsiella quasipneumoniae]HBQ9112751.1 endo-N-neuraminidase [Klebsiella quasipneumoniae]
MSVPNQTPYNIYTANGLTTVFAYEFYLISASDIQVTINGNEVTSGYAVSGVGNTNGGEVTFLTAPANGTTVIFERVTPTYRLTDYQDNGDLLADTVNKDFDRLWMAIQRAFIYLGVALSRPLFGGGPFDAGGYRIANIGDPVNDQDAATKKFVVENGKANLARTLRVPESSVGMLPDVAARKNKILAFNSQGDPIPVMPESGSAADVLIELASKDLPGTSLVIGSDGASLDQSIKFITPLLKPGVENAVYNYTILQAAADKNKHLDLPKGDFYVSQAFQAAKGQIIKGQGNPNFSPNCYTRLICMTEGGGCIWYTQDTSTGQVRMPQIYNMGLTGDHPVRFNNEQTAIIKDDISLSNVPFGMVPKVINCAINPRVNGIGIGISWSKMFDGIITCCEVANFDIDVLLNGCDLNWVAHNRIRNGWRYMVLELSASTFGSQNIIYHNDVLHAGSPNCIMIKSTARHARIIDNYLEQATGTDREALIGFIDATDVDAPSYAGNVSAGRYSTILRDNRIDGFSKAKYFGYKYQPKGQTYGEIVDVSTVGSNVGFGSNALTLVDETGATVDSVPLLYNQQQPCSFVFKGPRFGKWNGYTSEGQFSDVINGLNVGAFGTSLYGNLMSNYLRARGNEMVLMAGFASTGIFSYAASAGLFEPEKSYIIEVEAYCSSGTEDFTFGGIVSGTGKVSTTFTLSTTPRKMRVEFVTGIAGSSNGIYFSRSNNGADIVIKRVRFLKKYLHENAMSASATKTLQITTQSGEIQISANGGNQFPAYKILKFINGSLVEIFSQASSSAVIDISWSYASGSLTVNVTGTGGSKQLAVSQTSQPG